MSYCVFIRDFWKDNPSWPNGLEPCLGPKEYIEEDIETEEEARQICLKYNHQTTPGRYSRKAEFEEE